MEPTPRAPGAPGSACVSAKMVRNDLFFRVFRAMGTNPTTNVNDDVLPDGVKTECNRPKYASANAEPLAKCHGELQHIVRKWVRHYPEFYLATLN